MNNINITMQNDGTLICNDNSAGRIEEYRASQLVIDLCTLFKSNSITYYTISFEPYGLGKKIVTDHIYKNISSDEADVYYYNGKIYCPIYDYVAVAPTVTMQIDGYETNFYGDVTAIYKSGVLDLHFDPSLTGEGFILDSTRADINLSEKIKNIADEKFSSFVIDENKLTDGCVTEPKLAMYSVSNEKIQTGAITSSKLADSSVTGTKIGTNAVTGDKIPQSAISANHLQTNSVTSAKISSGAVSSAKLSSYCVTTSKIATDAVTKDKIADNSIDTSRLCDNSISVSKIINGAITKEKISSGAIDASKLENNCVTEQIIRNGAVSNDKISDGAVSTKKLADKSVTSDKLAEKYLTQGDFDDAFANISSSLGYDDELDNINSISVVKLPIENLVLGKFISSSASNDYTSFSKIFNTSTQDAVCCMNLPIRFNRTYKIEIDFTPIAQLLKGTNGTVYPLGHSLHNNARILTLSKKTENGFETVGAKIISHQLINIGGNFLINESSSIGKILSKIRIDDSFFTKIHDNADFSTNAGNFIDDDILYLSFNFFFITSSKNRITQDQWNENYDSLSKIRIYPGERIVMESDIDSINNSLNSILSSVLGDDD